MLSHRLGLLLLAALPGAAGKQKTGNILFLMCDSMDGRVLDPTSPVSSRLEMPNLRGLASRGVNFVRTYAASPQCVPSRTTMFAGRHTHQIKAWSNEQGFAEVPSTGELDVSCVQYYGNDTCTKWAGEQKLGYTMLDSMKHVGYDFEMFGKVDVGAGVLNDPMESKADPTVNGFHNGPTLSIITRTADIRRPTKPLPLDITDDKVNNVHPEDWKMLPNCIDFLNQKGNSDDKAWMMYCSINIPHPAFKTNATWLELVNEDKVTVPTWLNKSAFHPADSYQSISKNVWGDYTDAEILKVRNTYYAMCAETDYMMGLVMDALSANNLEDKTWVVFVSDHGEMNMEHRQVWKNSMYEASERVPFIIAPPKGMAGVRRGVVVSNLTSLLDVLPSMVDIAQIPLDSKIAPSSKTWFPDGLSGYSLIPFLSSDPDTALPAAGYPEGRSVAAQYHSNMGNTGSFMYRSGPWKYIAFGRYSYDKTYTPQLFNVDADPEELSDVAAENPTVVAELDAALRSVVDYATVDAEVRANDLGLYKKYFTDVLAKDKLLKKLKSSYSGFDDSDMQKIDQWVAGGGK